MARRRPQGSVDTASESFEARGVGDAIEAAGRALDAFLAGLPGVGVLTDTAQDRIVWSRRHGMPAPPAVLPPIPAPMAPAPMAPAAAAPLAGTHSAGTQSAPLVAPLAAHPAAPHAAPPAAPPAAPVARTAESA